MSQHDEPLRPEEILERVDLCSTEEVLGDRGGPMQVPEGLVAFGQPVGVEVDRGVFAEEFQHLPDADRWRYLRVVFPFGIERQALRREFVTVTITVRMADTSVVAFDLEPPNPIGDGGLTRALTRRPMPVTVAPRPGERVCGTDVTVEASGYGMSSYRWTIADAEAGSLNPGSYVVGAVLQVPAGTSTLVGELSAAATIRRPAPMAFRKVLVRTQRPTIFTVPFVAGGTGAGGAGGTGNEINGSRGGVGAGAGAGAVRVAVDGARRLWVATDVKGYGTRTTRQQYTLQCRFLRVLETAAENSGLDRGLWECQGQGDGELAVLPPGIDEPTAVADLIRELATALEHCNEDLNEQARIRLRLALHEGPAYQGPMGFPGDSAVVVCRLRDSDELRRELTEHPDADLVVAVSEAVYDTTVKVEARGLRADRFHPVTVAIPSKRFSARSWMTAVRRGQPR